MYPKAMLILPALLMLAGCVPRIEVAAPKEPITINMNVKIDHDIHIKADKNVEALLKKQSNYADKTDPTNR